MNDKRKYLFRRIVVFGIIFSLVGSFLVLAFGDTPTMTTTVATVYEGDSLWTLAAEYTDNRVDPRDWVHEVIQLNGLSSATIFPGQQLVVPIWE
jgi:hypothetical protein